MQITNVSQNSFNSSRRNKQNQNGNVSFKAAYVPTTRRYAARKINAQVAEFNEKVLPQILPDAKAVANATIRRVHKSLGIKRKQAQIKSARDFATKFDCFVLAGGPGNRFKPLSDPIGHINGEDLNKISTPFETQPGKPPFTMINPALAIEAIFAAGTKGRKRPLKAATAQGQKTAKAKSTTKKAADDFGFQKYTKSKERGNFWHIVDHYMKHPKQIKDVVIISGDNAFDVKAEEMLETIVRMKEEKQHLTMFGVKKTPEEVAKKFGVIGVQTPHREAKDLMALTAFQEKPELDTARKMAETSSGINIANTGSIVISKEAMTEIVKIARKEEAFRKKMAREIKKMGDKATPKMQELADDGIMGTFSRSQKRTDRFDFSTVQGWILKNMYKKEDIHSGKGPIVQMLDSEKWSDVGEPKAMFDMIQDVAEKGKFLQNFPKQMADGIRSAFQAKSHLADDGAQKALVVTNKYASLAEVPHDVMEKAPSVEGVKIIG